MASEREKCGRDDEEEEKKREADGRG